MLMPGANGFDAEQLNSYLEQIDDADDALLRLKSEHMTACKAPRAKIKGVMKEARAAGIGMAAFRTLVAKHRSERKIEEQIAELEADDKADFEEMQRALGDFGDTPLGEAALAKAKPLQHDQEALDRLGRG